MGVQQQLLSCSHHTIRITTYHTIRITITSHHHITMLSLSEVVSVLCLVLVSVRADCSTNQTNTARKLFKDCMDDKQAALLKINIEAEDDNVSVFCEGLQQFSSGCSAAIETFSQCKSEVEVTNLVAIHINSIAELLTRPGLDLKSCPAFQTSQSAPRAVSPRHKATQLPLRSSAVTVGETSLPSLLIIFIVSNVRKMSVV